MGSKDTDLRRDIKLVTSKFDGAVQVVGTREHYMMMWSSKKQIHTKEQPNKTYCVKCASKYALHIL
jgi:hypothetical protein